MFGDFGAYYWYPAVTSEPAQLPIPLAQGAGSAALDIRKKAGQAKRNQVRWPDRFEGNDCIRMENGPASGWF
jgi:hypothetical protein